MSQYQLPGNAILCSHFETTNECPSSVCSEVGVVIVREGEFVERFTDSSRAGILQMVLPAGTRTLRV